MALDQLSNELKLLSDKNRLTIVALLMEKELCVYELVEILQTSQPNVSQHIRKLKDGGLIKESKKGQWVYYSLSVENRPYLNHLLKYAHSEKEAKISWSINKKSNCCH